jgi:uncharacterized protein YbjT (DUF2867 family)
MRGGDGMNVLVVGGTGTVGREVTRQLLERGAQVRVMSRSADRSKLQLPVEAVQGDLEKPSTLESPFAGVDAVFLLNALSRSETTQGLAAVEATRKGGVGKIVYMSVLMPPGSEIIPHFASKIPVEQAVRESGLTWTILRPNNFYQNDLGLRDAIAGYGVYPQPIGDRGVTRIDVRDIADAAVNALCDAGHQGVTYPLNGPRAWTGEDTARVYTENLGRTVRYGGNDLDAWGKQVSAFLPEWLVLDLQIMYRFFQERGFQATPEELEMQRRLLGHDPRAFETFAWEVAPQWGSTAVGGQAGKAEDGREAEGGR